MKNPFFARTALFCLFFIPVWMPRAGAQTTASPAAIKSQWVYPGSNGRLVYKTTEQGDKIMDFSYAGYMGGGVRIPDVPVKVTLDATAGDNTDAIQKAINSVAAMPLVNGVRGAVLLHAGTYDCERALTINASGVVLRGAGSGKEGAVINMTGKPHACIVISGAPAEKTTGAATTIADAYVPSGTLSFTVADATGLAAGDVIRITRPVTDAWLAFMGMDQLVRDGKKQTWVSGDISTERIIRKVEKNTLTLDVPLSDSYDARYTAPAGTTVQKIIRQDAVSQIGIENFRIVSPAQSVTINDGHNRAFSISGITDGWARNIDIFNTVNSVSVTARRITVDNISILHEVPTIGAAKPADLNGSGPQVLFNHCTITGDNVFFLATGPKVTGPIVLLNCVFKGNGWIQPHQRWATGLLVDGCQVPNGGIDFMNRGAMGSGHGWAIGWAVAWNCSAQSFLNQQPPGAANWVIGCRGAQEKKAVPFNQEPLLPEGIYDAQGSTVSPPSLYLAQLSERLGKQALANIGY